MQTDNIISVFAHNVKSIRLNAGMSQEKLAEKTGLHRTYISDIERCQRNVTLDAVQRVANALNVRPSELLEGDNNE